MSCSHSHGSGGCSSSSSTASTTHCTSTPTTTATTAATSTPSSSSSASPSATYVSVTPSSSSAFSTPAPATTSALGGLRECYDEGVLRYGDGFPAEADTMQGLAAFARCAALVTSNELFSSNEEISEISTGHLRYLLVPFYLAMLSQRVTVKPGAGEGAELSREEQTRRRLAQLERSETHLIRFLKSLESLGVLQKADGATLQSLLDDAQLKTVGTGDFFVGPLAPQSREDAMRERQALMDRAQRLAKAKSTLKALEERRKRLRLAPTDEDPDSEEVEREHWLLMLEIHGTQGIDELKSLYSETKMLKQMLSRGPLPSSRPSGPAPSSASAFSPSSSAGRGAAGGRGGGKKPDIWHISEPGAAPQQLSSLTDTPKPVAAKSYVTSSVPSSSSSTSSSSSSSSLTPSTLPTSAAGFAALGLPDPNRRTLLSADEAALAVEAASRLPGGGIAPGNVHLGTVTRVATGVQDRIDQRGLISEAVFLPGYRMPTLMVEEAAEIEMSFAAKGPGGEASRRHHEDGDDDEDRKANDDEELKKQREWDDWCDYNPTGIGNRKRMG